MFCRLFAILTVAVGEDVPENNAVKKDPVKDLLGLDYSQIRAPKNPDGELQTEHLWYLQGCGRFISRESNFIRLILK